ncbi:MAG: energy transducer TonB [Rhodomicrobium sp.]
MNWVRLGSAGAALGVHMAALGLFVLSAMHEPDLSALQSGGGNDDLTIVATITMQSEESLGFDAASVQRQDASLGGQAAPEVQEEVKKEEEKVELPPEETQNPVPLVEEKKPEKKIVEPKPSAPAPASEAQEDQRAATRAFEARRNEVLSLYNSRVYQALMKNALRPKTMQKGRVVLELTLAPSGELLDHHVVVRSGSPALDKTAMTSLERAAPFPPVPPEVSKEPHTLRVPFEYAVK